MGVRMFYVVFGRKKMFGVVCRSNCLRLFCVIVVVFNLSCRALGSSCCLICSCQVVWSVLFVKL